MAFVFCVVASSEGATLTLKWDPPAEGVAAGYIVWAGTAAGQYSYSFNVGAVTTYEISGLAEGTKYYFAVQAYTAAGEMSALSTDVSGAVLSGGGICTVTPPAPQFSARAVGAMLQLAWAANGADRLSGYVLDVGSAAGRRDITSVQFAAETTSISAPAPPGTYFFRLAAVNACGTGAPAPDVAVTIGAAGAPGVPVALAQQVAGRTVTLTWSPPVDGAEVTRYLFEVTDTSGRPLLTLDTGNRTTSFVSTNTPPGQYVVRVRAANATGVGAASNAVTVLVTP